MSETVRPTPLFSWQSVRKAIQKIEGRLLRLETGYGASIDLFLDPASGEITIYVQSTSNVKRVDWAVSSSAFPDPVNSPDDTATPDSSGNATIIVPGGTLTASPGDTIYASVAFYDASDNHLTNKQDSAVMGRFLDCNPVLDEDDGTLYLHPNKGAFTGSVYYKVYTSGTPSSGDVIATGTLSTSENINVHTFTLDAESLTVAVVPKEVADGSGATGTMKTVPYTFHNANNNPVVTWHSYVPTNTSNEGVRIIAVDDSGTCRVYHRTYVDGAGGGAYTDSGLLSDPVVVSVPVARPAEGDNATVVEFYAEDAAGNTSGDPIQVRVDGNLKPSGWVIEDQNRSTGEPIVIVNTDDPDTGSWRLRVKKNAIGSPSFNSISYNDSEPTEFKGNSFGSGPSLSAYTLVKGERLDIECRFYRTTATTASAQNSSIKSSPVYLSILQAEETENKIRSATLEPVPQSDGTCRYLLSFEAGSNVASVNIAYTYWRTVSPNPADNLSYDYNVNVSGGSNYSAELLKSGGTLEMDLNVTTWGGVVVSPYDAVGGDAGSGNLGMLARPQAADYTDTGAGVTVTDGVDTYKADALVAGSGITLTSSGGRPSISVGGFSYGTGSPGTLGDGEVYFQVNAV